MANTANAKSASTTDRVPISHPTLVSADKPTGFKKGAPNPSESPEEQKVEDVANKAAHKAAKTEQEYAKEQELFSK
jgi:hypothetical protein